MTDAGTTDDRLGFARLHAFEVGSVAAAAGGPAGILVADADGTVLSVDADGREVVAEPADVVDVAVGDREYVLSAEGLAAFTAAGERAWLARVAGESVTADPVTDDVYVRTDADEFVRFDGETGAERAAFDQPHADVAEAPATAARDGRLAVASWTFLTVLAPDGEGISEVALDGASTDVGFLDDEVVVSLKDGQLVSYEGETRSWRLDRDASWLAEVGGGALLCAADDRVSALREGGDVREVADVRGTPVAAAPDASLLCTHRSGMLTAYGATDGGGGDVTATVPTEAIPRSDPAVDVVVENGGDTTVETTATVAVDGATPVSRALDLTIPPGDRSRRRLALRDVEGVADLEVTVSVGGEETTATVPVREQRRELDASVDPVGVDRGELTLEATVRNEGDAPLRGVVVEGRSIGDLDPGESRTLELRSDLPSAPVTVGSDDVPDETYGDSIPPTPTGIDVTVDDGLVVVALDNETPAPVVDDLGVEGAHLPDERLEYEVEIPPRGRYRLALPVLEGGDRRVLVETSAGRVSREFALSRTPALESLTAAEETTEDVAADSSAAEFDRDSAAESGPVSTERTLSASTPARGRKFTEELAVANESDDAVEFELVTDDGHRLSLRLGGGERATGRRSHAAFADEVTVPAVRLEGDWGTVVEPARELSVEDGSLVPRLAWSESETGAELRYEFDAAGTAWTLSSVAFADGGRASLDLELGAGETRAGAVDLDWTPSGEVVTAEVSGVADGEDRTVRTLVPHESLVDRAGEALDDLTVEADLEWHESEQFGSLFLTLRNDGEGALSDLRIEPEGDAVPDWAKPHEVATLPAGEQTDYSLHPISSEPGEAVETTFRLTAEGSPPRRVLVRAQADEDGYVPPETLQVRDGGSPAGFPDRVSGTYR